MAEGHVPGLPQLRADGINDIVERYGRIRCVDAMRDPRGGLMPVATVDGGSLVRGLEAPYTLFEDFGLAA